MVGWGEPECSEAIGRVGKFEIPDALVSRLIKTLG